MIKISNIRIEVGEELCLSHIAKKINAEADSILSYKIIKKSVDARKKNDVHYVLTVCAEVANEKKYLKNKNVEKYEKYELKIPKVNAETRPIIVGCGPAGLFAGLYLAYSHQKPLIIERGECVDKRIEAVKKFWNEGVLNPKTNVQFGEGGAGTFSDGKLTTGVNDARMEFIKQELVKFGAPEEILYLAKPHIGTDKLCVTVKNIRREIIKLGGEVRFNTQLIDVFTEDEKLTGIEIFDGTKKEIVKCENLILAVGHSARDTLEMIKERGFSMERKAFSIGGRIEHLQSDIGFSQYGEAYKKLPAADYKLSVRTTGGRGVYTFCMCPGGVVVGSASEESGVVTNGMSYYKRDGVNANSALLVTVNPEDIDGDDVLGGVYLQKEIERKAFSLGGENYYAPIQRVGDFLKDEPSNEFGSVLPTYLPGTKFSEIKNVLPDFVTEAMREAILLMDKKLKGFANPDALITVPETRSSSPVRIKRDAESFEADISGVYPCGEGAGYAGGIMSAALDGIRCAEALIKKYT